MMKTLYILLFMFLICGCTITQSRREKGAVIYNGIQWEGQNPTANYLAREGLNHYITFEWNHAFILSEAAVTQDSSLFASHALLAMLGTVARKDYHKKMAKKYVENKNETSKLFVSLLDVENDSSKAQSKTIWSRMHKLSNDPFIHYMYIRHMDISKDTTAVLEELDILATFSIKNKFYPAGAAAYNMKGYILKRIGAFKSGTVAIEKAIKLHPEGYNPLDSRAEFHLYAGDTLKAIDTYKKVLEKYPYAQNALRQLKELDVNL